MENAFMTFEDRRGPDENAETQDAYFNWLVGKIKGGYYETLLYKLYLAPFCAAKGSLDWNRVRDGLRLRSAFMEETNGHFDCTDGPCSFLEMLISLAMRLDDDIMYEERYGPRYLDWFWTFIENLGMSQATNDKWNWSWEKYVDGVLRGINEKTYGENGEGGLFRVYEHPGENLRKIDIWRQMIWWVDENLRRGVID